MKRTVAHGAAEAERRKKVVNIADHQPGQA
jgi:hypothetical protein